MFLPRLKESRTKSDTRSPCSLESCVGVSAATGVPACRNRPPTRTRTRRMGNPQSAVDHKMMILSSSIIHPYHHYNKPLLSPAPYSTHLSGSPPTALTNTSLPAPMQLHTTTSAWRKMSRAARACASSSSAKAFLDAPDDGRLPLLRCLAAGGDQRAHTAGAGGWTEEVKDL